MSVNKCDELIDSGIVDLSNPFKHIKQLKIKNIILVSLTVMTMLILYVIVENVGIIHDYIYTNARYNTNIGTEEEGEWVSIGNFEINEMVCYGMVTNDSCSSGPVKIRITGDTEWIHKFEAGSTIQLKFRKGVTYKIEIAGSAGNYYISIN